MVDKLLDYHDVLALNIIIIISGFGIYGAAVVPDSGVGNTWQRLTLVLHERLNISSILLIVVHARVRVSRHSRAKPPRVAA